MDWIEIAKTFGLPVALMGGLLWFGYKAIWPFIVARVDRAEARLDVSQSKFDAALERRDANAAATAEAMKRIGDNLRDLAEEIRRK